MQAAVVDGDTLRCANVPERRGLVRLALIDAPERGQPNADKATRYLASLLIDQLSCEWADADIRTPHFDAHDRFGRRVARCSVNGKDLGARMVKRKLARPWP